MVWVELGEPEPQEPRSQYSPVEWPKSERLIELPLLPPSQDRISLDFGARRTRYQFRAVDLNTLSALLGTVCAIRGIGHSRYGFSLTQRGAPSAGGVHPIHLLLHLPSHEGWYRYDPKSHALEGAFDRADPWAVRRSFIPIVDGQDGALIVLAAEPGKTAAKYQNPGSLVWRDAGVLLGYLSLVATAHDLNFCPLGTTADSSLSKLVKHSHLRGVGAAFVGSRP